MRARAALVVILACSCSDAPGTMQVRTSVRELLLEEGALLVRDARADAPPEVAIVTPSIDPLQDGADRSAFVLPPPASAEVRIGSEGPVELVAAAGVDLSLARELAALGPGARPVDVRFEVFVNGERRFDATLTTRPKRGNELYSKGDVRHEWRRVRGTDGAPLTLVPGDTLRLATSLPRPLPEGVAPPRAGFADLRLERVSERARERATEERPNLVLIVVDTERADRTTPGSRSTPPRGTTPNLARLAARGTRFDQAYAPAPWTWPTTASLFTGLAPEAHGVLSYRSCVLARELDTLAEVLQAAGYTTAGFSGNPLVSPSRDFDQGFEFFDVTGELRASERFLPDVLAWIGAHADERFFLYVHLIDPHSPHVPRATDVARFCEPGDADDPALLDRLKTATRLAQAHDAAGRPDASGVVSEQDARRMSNLYDASVATADHWVGELLGALAREGLEGTTLVAYTADHGEELGDHGGYEHSHTLHEELLHVPLVLAGPGIAAGATRSIPVSNRHLAPTLARLGGARLDVADAVDLAQDTEPPARALVFGTHKGLWNGHEPTPLYGVRRGPWKYVFAPEGLPWGAPKRADPGDGEERLYHLGRDPFERDDVLADEPGVAAELRHFVLEDLARQTALRPRASAAGVGAGEATLAVLRGLGYVGDDEGQGE